MKLIGYWNNSYSQDYIDPIKLVDESYYRKLCHYGDSYELRKVITYLKNGFRVNSYRGYSSCRICGKMLGTYERTDFEYVWPDELDHYVEEHFVRLPDEFIKKIIDLRDVEVNEDYWKNWCKSQLDLEN